jgi:hypothetical protein
MPAMRKLAGAVAIGSFAVVAVTGVLMLFRARFGLMTHAHESIGLLMVVGVVAHIIANWKPFCGYFKTTGSLVIIAALFVLGAASLLIPGRTPNRQYTTSTLSAVERSSLSAVAQVAQEAPEALVKKLEAKGIRVSDTQTTIQSIASENGVASAEVLDCIFAASGAPGPR